MIKNVRVRFAPSPTGFLHVGGLRTALYNYLFAKKEGGKFILRIEDTDRNRFVEGAVDNLLKTLEWVGLEYDEGPKKGGDSGPYIQSERLHIYHEHAEKLIEKNLAYRCFCTPERLKTLREEQQRLKLPQAKYDKKCLNLTPDEIRNNLDSKKPFVIRLNVTHGAPVLIKDIVRGIVEFNRETIDDQVLIKSDGYPTYHLANVVDDHLMSITHVIRGEEWLSSTPKHILLYEYFGWAPPEFAHLPLLLNPDRSKLSKRQGDVAVEDYRDKGYLKESLINFVALLGWSAGDNREFFTMNDLTNNFSLERVHKSGAIFNVDKLNWLNSEHLKNLPDDKLLSMIKQALSKSEFKDKSFEDSYLIAAVRSMIERITFINEMFEKSPYFFEPPKYYDEAVLKKRWKADTPVHLKKLAESFEKMTATTKDDFEHVLRKTAEDLEIGAGKLIHPARLAVSGIGIGPGIFDLLHIIGKDEVNRRIYRALETIKID